MMANYPMAIQGFKGHGDGLMYSLKCTLINACYESDRNDPRTIARFKPIGAQRWQLGGTLVDWSQGKRLCVSKHPNLSWALLGLTSTHKQASNRTKPEGDTAAQTGR